MPTNNINLFSSNNLPFEAPGITSGDQIQIFLYTFLGSDNPFKSLLKIRDKSLLVACAVLIPNDSTNRTEWPSSASEHATCCLFVQSG